MGFPRQGYWSGLPCHLPGDLPNPGIEAVSPELQVDSLPLSYQGSPEVRVLGTYYFFGGGGFCQNKDIKVPFKIQLHT